MNDGRRRVLNVMVLVLLILAAPMLHPPEAGASESLRLLWVGDRIMSFVRHTVQGQARLWTPSAPAIIIFWARWSPSSLRAVKDLVAAEPKSAARWEIMPINVDHALIDSREAASIEAALRQTGYQGPVWYDAEYDRVRRWGLLSVPTVIIARMGGIVELAEVGWSRRQRDRIISTYCGAMTDTTHAVMPDSIEYRCRRDLSHARFLWQSGAGDSAKALARRVQSACSTMADPSILLSWWHWEAQDTVSARAAAAAAVQADSTNPWGWVTLAAVEELCGRCEEARSCAARALALDSTFTPPRFVMARCALIVGDTLLVREAVSHLEKTSRHDPELALIRAKLRELRGDLAGAAADWHEAIGDYLRRNDERVMRRVPRRSGAAGP
ncbi:MAG: hypothetical protein AB1792_02665 [Candidatus Zixiibacteriota bacterium]